MAKQKVTDATAEENINEAEAKEKNNETTEAERKAFLKQNAIDRMKEPVSIELFRDNNRYSEDWSGTVNGVTTQIQRGKRVSVPRYVADVEAQQKRQDNQTAEMIRNLQDDFEKKSKNI